MNFNILTIFILLNIKSINAKKRSKVNGREKNG